MRENKIACVPIERPFSNDENGKTYTVGISFLTDIMYLLKLPNYYRYLNESVISFVAELNGIDGEC